MGKLWPQWSHCNCEGAGVFIHQPQSLRVASGGYKFPSTLGLSPRQNDFLNDRESLEKQRTLGRQLECARRVRSWGWRQALSAYLIQFSSVIQLCLTLCNPMNHSTPGLPVHQQLPESTQTHVHWVRDAIQPSHSVVPFSSCCLSQHQGLFTWVSSSHQVAKVLEFQLQHQSYQWTPRTGLLY